MLIRAAISKRKKIITHRMINVRRSYRMGNQMRLPKHRLYIGQAIVGIQVRSSRKDTTPTQIVVFHLPRGAKRSRLRARHAISIPKIKVMYPITKIPAVVSPCPLLFKCFSAYQEM